MMVLKKQPVEQNRNILGKKGRKKSTDKWIKASQPIAPSPDALQEHDQLCQVPHLENGERSLPGEHDSRGSVSMESMVSLPRRDMEQEFNKAITLLRLSRYKEAAKQFQDVIKQVQAHNNYGEYVIYKRTQNKRTTLSALHMFLALAYEGLSNPRKAIECCNNAISEDPGWPIPFSKRSENFGFLEQYFLDTDGGSKEEMNKSRETADIIVGRVCPDTKVEKSSVRATLYFDDLQDALDAASDGSVIFLEKGFYYREQGFSVACGCRIVGASTRGCVLMSKGNPTLQIFGAKQSERRNKDGIHLSRLQFRNKLESKSTTEGQSERCETNSRLESSQNPTFSQDNLRGCEDDESGETRMRSNAAHIFIISPEKITIRDCLFAGGDEGTGGILIAEEAFYQSLLELEFQNPEMVSGTEDTVNSNLTLLITSAIFSDCHLNPVVFSNSQSSVIISNSFIYNSVKGLIGDEGSTINVVNCEINNCNLPVQVANSSNLNIRGSSFIGRSPESEEKKSQGKRRSPGLKLSGTSSGSIVKSYFRYHDSAVLTDRSDLVFDSNCVMDIGGDSLDLDEIGTKGFELQNGAVSVIGPSNTTISNNNFFNCSLVFQIQQGGRPTITNNNVETCLIGLISGSRSSPRLTGNIFQYVLMSIGISIEQSTGLINNNTFRYAANGLDVYHSAAPVVKDNTYEKLELQGLQSSSSGKDGLAFDIQKVSSTGGDVEELENSDVISFPGPDGESAAAARLANRQTAINRLRLCPFCRQRVACTVQCDRCRQIWYCSQACCRQDDKRHANFCSLSLKDMF